MNNKLSGGQLVLVPIKNIGRNYFPFVENIKRRVIKYIDFIPLDYLPDTTARGLEDYTDGFLTLFDEAGNTELQRNLPLTQMNYIFSLGIRHPICSKVNLAASYIDIQNSASVGKTAAFIFWYDLPEYSARNTTDTLVLDSVSIPITTTIRYNQFPDSDRMVGKRFRRILLSIPTKTPDLREALGSDELRNVFVTLRKGSYSILENIPVSVFYQLTMLQKTEFQNIIFDFQSSYLTVGGAGTIPDQSKYVGKSVFFNVQYER